MAYTLPVFPNPPHQAILAAKLEALERGDMRNLMVIMPPRHLKSETCSIRFPSWYLGRHQQDSIIGCSYSDNKAYAFSYAVREVVLGSRYQKLWPSQLQTSGAMHWMLSGKNDLRPSYIAAGVGGGITGEGANILVIDDPIKNQAEANSKLIRDNIWQWYITTALTRLQPDGKKIIVMTRWHDDDLAGRLLRLARRDPKADQWDVLHLKAVAGADDPLGRQEGAALWPEKFPIEYLERIRSGQIDDPDEPGKGSRAFAAIYQGEPAIAEGNIIKREWWKFYAQRPQFVGVVHSWDTAFKSNTESDYSVCTVWGIAKSGYYLLDVWRARVEFPELKRVALALYTRDRPQAVIIEDKSSGQSLVQELRRETIVPVLPIKVDSDKVARAYAVTPLIEAGRVYLPERAAWLHDYIEEMSAFPAGEHDDQVDSTTQGLYYLTTSSYGPVDAPAPERQSEFAGLRGRQF